MFGAVYFRIPLWSVPRGMKFFTLGSLPLRGVQNVTPPADEDIYPFLKVVPITA